MRPGPVEAVVGEVQRLVDHPAQMSVGRPVDHAAALLAHGHQPGQPQFRQVLADGRAGRAAELGQRADVGLLLPQRVQDAEPGAVGEQPERLGGEGVVLGARVSRVRILCR